MFIGDGTAGGGNAPFLRTDPRLRNIPFATRRPTVKEVQNAFAKLAAVYEVSSDQLSQGLTPSPKFKAKPKKPVVTVKEKETITMENRSMAIEEVGTLLNEVDLKQEGSSDEMEEGNSAAGGTAEKTAKRKKRRRAKKTTEPQGMLSDFK